MNATATVVPVSMRPYELGDEDLDARIRALAEDAVTAHGHDHGDVDLVHEMLVTTLKLHRDDADRGDLKLVNSALKEMRYSFLVFSRFREIPKVTIFGSARTPPHDPNYQMAADFASHMAGERGWMVITGAGPGIMEAGSMGAGRERGFGVNIRLPFEGDANPYIHESRLINFKYFFTRKLMFMKESHAFALFPGGFGTQDETFELLTLIQTGKSDLHPVVLLEAPGTGYWEGWLDFLRGSLLDRGMITPEDLDLFTYTTDAKEAARAVCDFYAVYHSQRFVGDDLVLRLKAELSDEQVERLNDEYSDIVVAGTIASAKASDAEIRDGDHVDLPRIKLHFNRRSLGRLRSLIDTVNGFASGEDSLTAD